MYANTQALPPHDLPAARHMAVFNAVHPDLLAAAVYEAAVSLSCQLLLVSPTHHPPPPTDSRRAMFG
jgi:hypothetical protein